ncbi:HPr kinase/phosphatase C-terminal domain-containing protein [Ferrovibrio sp.]|uniref:HPr kinase/phosphorylase n=1 Tax=Ferrovibrio sp. TaxID=1917215 RepID=UPI0025C51244|nr:HPr kinase/phosphatase C-terminal domain-containing protein [Ferrovibrio sp.]MBX3453345.1 HPr kinase/phosphatase C-terminal domain-containing protein [Ferrovibrio sp.]
MQNLHATCVALDEPETGKAGAYGLLLRGPSGAGKSDLALRMIAQGARLVADDQVMLQPAADGLHAAAPAALRDIIEIRGIGLVRMPALDHAMVTLLIDLVPPESVPRLPDPAHETLCGITLPLVRLEAFSAAAALKALQALRLAKSGLLFRPAPGIRPLA